MCGLASARARPMSAFRSPMEGLEHHLHRASQSPGPGSYTPKSDFGVAGLGKGYSRTGQHHRPQRRGSHLGGRGKDHVDYSVRVACIASGGGAPQRSGYSGLRPSHCTGHVWTEDQMADGIPPRRSSSLPFLRLLTPLHLARYPPPPSSLYPTARLSSSPVTSGSDLSYVHLNTQYTRPTMPPTPPTMPSNTNRCLPHLCLSHPCLPRPQCSRPVPPLSLTHTRHLSLG